MSASSTSDPVSVETFKIFPLPMSKDKVSSARLRTIVQICKVIRGWNYRFPTSAITLRTELVKSIPFQCTLDPSGIPVAEDLYFNYEAFMPFPIDRSYPVPTSQSEILDQIYALVAAFNFKYPVGSLSLNVQIESGPLHGITPVGTPPMGNFCFPYALFQLPDPIPVASPPGRPKRILPQPISNPTPKQSRTS